MTAPVSRRPGAHGTVDVYPLALPDGEGVSIPLGEWGEVGFANERGALVLEGPSSVVEWLAQRLAHIVVRNPERVLGGVGRVWFAPTRGERAVLPLGSFGEAWVEFTG